jgi:hypothetical protein
LDPPAELLVDELCRSWMRVEEARALIRRDGLVLVERTAAGDEKHRAHPACGIERDSLAALHRAWRLLGYDQQPPV